jgi:hypothetical protein
MLCSIGVPWLDFICVVLWWYSWAGLHMCCALVVFLGWTSYVLCSGGVSSIVLGLDIIHGML